MKTLCITGPLQGQLELIAAQLSRAGVNPAQPSGRETPMDLATWHAKVIATRQSRGAGQNTATPGRLWEQLAGEIFLANIDQACWGWADTRSLKLLDFWHDFEAGTRFVLVCATPEEMLAQAIETGDGEIAPQNILQTWHTAHREMLRFYLRHPDRALLIWGHDALQQRADLCAALQQQWQLPLTAAPAAEDEQAAINPVARMIAQQLCREHSVDESLLNELRASSHTPAEAGPPAETMSDIVAAFRQLKLGTVTEAELAAEKERADNAENQLQAETQKHREAQEESELLLLQLHQVQEELESLFLKHNESQTELATVRAAKTASETEAATRQQEAATLMQQLDAIRAQLAAAQAAKTTSKTEAATRQQEAAALTQQLDAVRAQLEPLQRQQQEAQEESELLLLQLHQVQEELENYFLKYQEAQQKLSQADERWQRMLARSPEYIDYARIECTPLANADGREAALAWEIEALDAAGRSFEQLRLETFVEADAACLSLKRNPDGSSPLTRWPLCARDEDAIVLIPAGPQETLLQRAQAFINLAHSDWPLLTTLPKLLNDALNQQQTTQQIGNTAARERTQAGLAQFEQIVGQLQGLPRFDTATLKREQINPDYEHLWFEVNNLQVGGKLHPRFEFRLSCANVRPGKFGQHPKLEFPAASQHCFEQWFEESADDFGPKLEQRFALPGAMDIEVWRQLSPADQKLVLTLLELMPQVIDAVKQNGARIRRDEQQWLNLAAEARRIALQVSQAQAAAAKAHPARS